MALVIYDGPPMTSKERAAVIIKIREELNNYLFSMYEGIGASKEYTPFRENGQRMVVRVSNLLNQLC